MTTQCESLIEQLQEARRYLIALADQAPTDKYIYPHWTIKEYIDHLSGWDDALVEALEAHARNEPVPQSAARGVNAYNAQTVSTHAALDLAHSRGELTAGHERVIRVIRKLPDEKINEFMVFPWGERGTVKDFITIFIEHDKEHTKDLETWLKHPDKIVVER